MWKSKTWLFLCSTLLSNRERLGAESIWTDRVRGWKERMPTSYLDKIRLLHSNFLSSPLTINDVYNSNILVMMTYGFRGRDSEKVFCVFVVESCRVNFRMFALKVKINFLQKWCFWKANFANFSFKWICPTFLYIFANFGTGEVTFL